MSEKKHQYFFLLSSPLSSPGTVQKTCVYSQYVVFWPVRTTPGTQTARPVLDIGVWSQKTRSDRFLCQRNHGCLMKLSPHCLPLDSRPTSGSVACKKSTFGPAEPYFACPGPGRVPKPWFGHSRAPVALILAFFVPKDALV